MRGPGLLVAFMVWTHHVFTWWQKDTSWFVLSSFLISFSSCKFILREMLPESFANKKLRKRVLLLLLDSLGEIMSMNTSFVFLWVFFIVPLPLRQI